MRRRRSRGAWLPPDPTNYINYDGQTPIQDTTSPIIKVVRQTATNNAAASSTVSIPLIGDLNEDIVAGAGTTQIRNGTLADTKVGYSLKRVVGKIWCAVRQRSIPDGALAAWLWMHTFGIIVRRVDENGDPIAAFSGNNFADTYDAATDPYLWRRQYMLANNGEEIGSQIPDPASEGFVFGRIGSNGDDRPGGTFDGPHVDAKTRRTVKSEERLFLDWTITALNGSDPASGTEHICIFDLRFFGRVFTSAGNQRNASR